MTNEEVDKYADDNPDLAILKFENPSFNNSIVGISADNRIIYDYDLMIKDLSIEYGMTYEEAIEYIEANTLQVLQQENAPVI